MGQWLDSLTGWLSANPQWLGLAIFLVACIECLAIAGIIVPGTVLLFAVAVLAGSGAFSLGETLLLGFLGGLLGDAVSYTLGKYFHQNIRRLPLLRHHPEWIGSAESYFQRYGIASLLVGRFIGPLRPMLPMVAGMFDMPLPRFIAVSLVAGAGWSVAYLLPGWATGAAMRLPLPEGFWLDAGIIAGALAVIIGLSLTTSIRDQRHGTRLIAGMSFAALAGVFLGWPYLHEFDQGVMTLVQEHRSQAIDGAVVLVTRLGDFRTQLFLGGLLTGLLLLARQWRHAFFAAGALMGTAIANGTLKWLFARARPSADRPTDQLQHAQRAQLGVVCVLSGDGGAGRARPAATDAPDLGDAGLYSGAGDCPVTGVPGGALADRYPGWGAAGVLRVCA